MVATNINKQEVLIFKKGLAQLSDISSIRGY